MSKTKAEMIGVINDLLDIYNKLASVTKFKQYPTLDCLAEYHKDTVAECYSWALGVRGLDSWSLAVRYWDQQPQARWLWYHKWGDPTEFEDYVELRRLVKLLKAQIKLPKPLMPKFADRYKKGK